MRNRIDRFREIAGFCLQKGNLEKAGAYYSKILALDPEHEESFAKLTFVAYALDAREALKILLKLQKKTTQHLNIQIKLGDLFQQLGYSKKAIQIFLTVKETHPENADTYFKLGTLYKQKGEHSVAETYFEEAFNLNPTDKRIFNSYFDQLYILGKEDSIAEASAKLLQLNEDNAEIYILLGNAYKRIYKLEEAILHYKKALGYCPENDLILYQLGATLLLENNFLEAALVFKKAKEVNPKFSQAASSYRYALQALMNENEQKK